MALNPDAKVLVLIEIVFSVIDQLSQSSDLFAIRTKEGTVWLLRLLLGLLLLLLL